MKLPKVPAFLGLAALAAAGVFVYEKVTGKTVVPAAPPPPPKV
jgi:hypothetical protein